MSFEVAERVFGDPARLSKPDDHPDEDRWLTIGKPRADSHLVLFVVHPEPEDEDGTGRIISARRATPLERDHYEAG